MKNKIAKILTGISIVAAGTTPMLTASCGDTPAEKHAHIMTLSDIHGEIPGYGDDFFSDKNTYAGAIRMADAMQQIAENATDTLILSGGDQNSSCSFSACTKGQTMYPVLKKMDIRYSAVGNHAWDWGADPLQNTDDPNSYDKMGRIDGKTQGKYFIACNIMATGTLREREWTIDKEHEKTPGQYEEDYALWQANKCTWADPYKVVELDKHKICLIGLTTKSVYTDGNVKETESISISDYVASVNYAKRFFQENDPETFNQIESFILLTHCGCTNNDGKLEGDAVDIAIGCNTAIDAVIAGHNHTDICCKVYNNIIDKPVTIVETRDKMQDFADLEFIFDDTKPVGQRLKEIKPKLVTPSIDSWSISAARSQINNIIANPRNEIVKAVCEEYANQKEKAKNKLNTPIGSTANGLDYLQSKDLYAYYYPNDFYIEQETTYAKKKNCFVEQAGAFAVKSEIAGFNANIATSNVPKVSIGYIGNTSIQSGISKGEINLKSLYNLFPYDNYVLSITLTYHQLKQFARYILTGRKLDTEPRLHEKYCTDSYTLVEDGDPFTPAQHRYPYGASQFYGFCFDIKAADSTDTQYREFDAVFDDTHELKVYDPNSGDCDLDDPTTWKGKDYWAPEGGEQKYIRMVISSFNYVTLNKRNLMLPVFAQYNEALKPEDNKVMSFTHIDPRDLCEAYILGLPDPKVCDLFDDICRQLMKK